MVFQNYLPNKTAKIWLIYRCCYPNRETINYQHLLRSYQGRKNNENYTRKVEQFQNACQSSLTFANACILIGGIKNNEKYRISKLVFYLTNDEKEKLNRLDRFRDHGNELKEFYFMF